MADCVINSLKEIGKCIWPPVKLHIDYWWCFDGNVQGLSDEILRLEMERSIMNQKIEKVWIRAEIARPEVENWLNEVTRKLEEAKRILQGCVASAPPACDIKSRYLAGKSAKETAEGITRLLNEGNSIRIADPPPPASNSELQSRKSIKEDILKSLKDDNVHVIAICGAGGVGKTTMAQRVEVRAIKEKLFDEVVTVVVSPHIDMFKIQKQIAEMLGLGLSEETLVGRAHKLHTRLMVSKKKLIIFDDVWESFNLEDIGVPYGGCKIMLTSRLKDVCKEMDADKVIEIQALDKKEAWTLFREKAGDCVERSDMRSITEDVAAECKGLPIALVTVGKALQKKDINIWKDALSQLRKANPIHFALQKKNINIWKDELSQLRKANPADFPEVLEDVYMPLKLCFDCLESESEKSLFLLCCLFPEDYDIPIEKLALLSFGLGMFDGIDNIEDGRNRTYNLLERLRSRFLLMPGRNEEYVKMHDVVRDVAIYIYSKDKKGFLKSLEVSIKDSSRNCYWMSVEISNIANATHLVELDFPNLLLMILNSSYFEFPEGFDLNDICLKGMEELRVLYFSDQNFQSLPSSLKFLKKLRKLHLDNCEVKDISVVGELTSLEILRILGCNDIEELPANVRELKSLRLLELRDCYKLERIGGGVISSLVGLEELKIVRCFNKWEAKGNGSEERNASLSELECLHNLTSLEIDIFDPNLVAQEILLSKQLRSYQIRSSKFLSREGKIMKHKRKITLCLPRDVTVGNWIRRLAKNTQFLALDGDGSNYFKLGEIGSLRNLVFQNCSIVKKLVNAVDCKFPLLEHLHLKELGELEEIIDGTIPEGSNSFQYLESLVVEDLPKLGYLWKSTHQNFDLVNLKSIDIIFCPSLRYLFSMETAGSLVRLESLQISFCERMELVLWNEMESSNTEEASIIGFPKLKKLQLWSLPNLLGFTQLGVEIIKFPQLIQLQIEECPKLRTKINNYPTCMIMIEELCVSDCDAIEEIFRDDGNRHIIFQELRKLRLDNLPCLTTFYGGVESIKFPKLQALRIENLARLNSFVEIEDSEADTHDHHSLHFFCNKKVEIIGLKTLHLKNLRDKINKIWCCHIPISSFHDLESLSIFGIDGIKNLISSSIAIALVNLKELKISWCQQIIDVIEEETNVCVDSAFQNLQSIEISDCPNLRCLFSTATARSPVQLQSLTTSRDDGNRHIIFQELRKLRLDNLPRLTTFYRGVESIKFPKLKELWIENLPRLNSFVEIEDSKADTHDHHSLHFFCNEKVEIIGLETLFLMNLSDKIFKIWCRRIPISFFHNLERLDMYDVDGIKNLISSSIAIALVNLKVLRIERCPEIIELIEEETHVCVHSAFPNLKSVHITNNCKLRRFCQWKHAFELPSLDYVRIVDCPLMETFTLGSLSTPKLHRFIINGKDIEMKDLNDGIHHFISTENANEDENSDEYNEDENSDEYNEEKTENNNNNLM